jgi:uncharacterized protein (DUF983 family)
MKMIEAKQVLIRGFKLKCPACGQDSLYQSTFKIKERCASCGLVYGREQGYFVGAIYINVMATEGLILFVYLFLFFAFPLMGDAVYVVLLILAVTLPLIFFRLSRSLWLSIDHIISPRRDHIGKSQL